MKAIVIEQHGGTEVLQIRDVPKPAPKAGEVLVKVRASGLNHMDLWVRRGIPGMKALPLISGCDASGEVEAVGAGVTQFKEGDAVVNVPLFGCGVCFACLNQTENLCRQFKILGEHVDGTHQEYLCFPESWLLPKPKNVDFITAAAFPLTYLTAWHMLMARAKILPTDSILIMAATSGVGVAALQMAKAKGLKIAVTAGDAKKRDFLLENGVKTVVDHRTKGWSKNLKNDFPQGFDVIFEHIGEAVFDEVLRVLAWGGRLVTCGATSGPFIQMDLRHLFIKQQSLLGSTLGTRMELMAVCQQIEDGILKPIVGHVLKPQNIAVAHELLEEGRVTGKVIIDWGN